MELQWDYTYYIEIKSLKGNKPTHPKTDHFVNNP